MNAKPKIRVLSSYIYRKGSGPHEEMGKENKWFNGFVKQLVRNGYSLNDVDVNFVSLSSNRENDINVKRRFNDEGVSLVICPGTDAVVRWSKIESSIPTMYFGAHPENNGLELSRQINVCGVRLNLPLIWSSKNFSIIKKVLPGVDALYCPLNLESEFAFDNVRELFNAYRQRNDKSWIPHGSHYIGHRSISFLAEGIGCHYHEAPFIGLDEFKKALNAIPTSRNVAIIGFNDIALLPGAVNSIEKYVTENDIPLLWINNSPIISACGVVDYSSDFYRVGIKIGEIALKILTENATPNSIGLVEDQGEKTAINLKRCAELGIKVPEDVVALFDVKHQ